VVVAALALAGRKREEETARSDFWRKVERVAVFVVLGSSMELGVSSSLWAPIVVGVFWFLWWVAGEMGFFGGADRMFTAVVAGMGKMNDEMEQGDSDVRIRYTMPINAVWKHQCRCKDGQQPSNIMLVAHTICKQLAYHTLHRR